MAQTESSTLSFRLPDAAAGDRPRYAGMNVERPLLLAAIGRFGSAGEESKGNKWPVLWVQWTLSVTSSRCFYKHTNGRPTQDEERVSLTADSNASSY